MTAIPKVELRFQLQHCYADLEVVCIFELLTQPSEIALELKIANQSEVTTHFKVSTSDYLPPDTTFLQF